MVSVLVYVTGDMHGDLGCFGRRRLRRLKKGDTLIVCGDFGFVFDGSEKEKRALKWIGRRRYNVVFVEGLHDNLDLIAEYPTEEWNGGMTHAISGRLRHLCRGHIFDIDGFSILAFGGGGQSELEENIPWGSGLLPDANEIDTTRGRLQALGNKVDYIVTHQCGGRLRSLLTMREDDANALDIFLDEQRAGLSYKAWFFAGFHVDKFIPPTDVALFEEVVKLGEPISLKSRGSTRRLRRF